MTKTEELGASFVDHNEQQVEFTTRQAGRLGGLTTLSRYGIAHYRKIGQKGQASFTAKFTSAERRRWGKLGGRPRKHHDPNMGEKRQKDGRGIGSPPGHPASSPHQQQL